MNERKRILIVDDNIHLLKNIKDILKVEGYEIVAVEKGHLAVEKVEQLNFDVALIDVMLPDMDGLKAVEEIKEIDNDISIVIMSGHIDTRISIEAMKLGCHIVPKPIDPHQLRMIVKSAIREKILVVENKITTEYLKEQKRTLEVILELSNQLHYVDNLKELGDILVEKLSLILKANIVSMMLVNNKKKQLHILAAKGLDQEIINNYCGKIGEGVAGWVAKKKELTLVPDVEHFPYFQKENDFKYLSKSFISAPILYKSSLLGVINVSGRVEVFTATDAKFVSLITNLASLSVKNIELITYISETKETDFLTNLFNEFYFKRCLNSEIKRAYRYESSFSLVGFNIDNFEEYEKTHGKLASEILIKIIAGVVKGNTRDVDVVSMGRENDIFVILPQTEKDRAFFFAEKIREKVQNINFSQEGISSATISAGVTSFSKETKNEEEMINQCLKALAQAKKDGGNNTYLLK
ncbi:response regulator [bacterium]|nr:response regulator [bacterium]